MRNRQVHLDFHTSERITGIGAAFSPRQFQDMLKLGHVDSITVFSKCHHGWSYHPTKVGNTHPHLGFDLLKAQIDAAHAINVRTPVYLSAGLDEQNYWKHPEWARRLATGEVPWAGTNDKAGFHELCMNTGYLDLLVAEVEEVCRTYKSDGIFLDIVGPRPCWCNTCVREMIADGQDPRDPVAMAAKSRKTYLNYTRRIRAAIDAITPGQAVFHNAGHIQRGDRELAHENTHIELESLPTGGWGYDHFPLSAGYARVLGMPFLGMTGKFHETWGEFGGYKHPNALRYECTAAIAQGAAVSVGDQLHPSGKMDEATYALIGAGYAEVEAREKWTTGATSRAEVALLSLEAAAVVSAGNGQMPKGNRSDDGAARILCEGHVLFDVVDAETDFARYRLLVLPDHVRLGGALLTKIKAYVAGGGKVLATGVSGLAEGSDVLALDFGCSDAGPTGNDPDYLVPHFDLPPWRTASFLVYGEGRKLNVTSGTVLAHRDPPYFNRDLLHFCSHRQTPNSGTDGGPAIVSGPAGTLIPWAAFHIYAERGQQVLRDMVLHCLRRELGTPRVETSLPAAGRVTLMRQEKERREVLHLLYATPNKRGQNVEVIEDLVPLHEVKVSVACARRPASVRLEPQGADLATTWADGRLRFTVPRVECHQMVVIADG